MSIPDLLQTGKVVAVTGGRRGLGKAMALAFAEAGANVAVCDMAADTGELEDCCASIRSCGRKALAMRVDVTCKADVTAFIAGVVAEFGGVDVLINSAGITGTPDMAQLSEHERTELMERRARRMTLCEGSEENFDKVVSVHVMGSYLCSKMAAVEMVKRKTGCIINLSSIMAYSKTGSAYNVAKAAIISLTRGLAWELGPHNIRVNALAPGILRTDMTRHVWDNPAVLQDMVNRTALKRLGEPEDAAYAALLLASDAARFITGQTILVDGGIWPMG